MKMEVANPGSQSKCMQCANAHAESVHLEQGPSMKRVTGFGTTRSLSTGAKPIYVTLCGKLDFADRVKIMGLKMGRLSWIIWVDTMESHEP